VATLLGFRDLLRFPGRQPVGFMSENQTVEGLPRSFSFFVGKLRDGFELKAEVVVGAAFLFSEK